MSVSTTDRSRYLEQALMRKIYDSSTLMMPHFTPPNWWECDVWAVTKSGYAVEYEVKVSRADFRKDRAKYRDIYTNHTNHDRHLVPFARKVGKNALHLRAHKLDLLEQGHVYCQNRFYYVTPEGLIEDYELPANCGLITFREYPIQKWKRVFSDHGKCRVRAPLLHANKPAESTMDRVRDAAYNRFIRREIGI